MAANASTAPFTEIGTIAKSHGLKGELKVQFETNSPDIVQQLEMVYLQNSRGDYFPCRIKQIRTEGKGNQLSFFVHFEHIADRTAAEELKNSGVYLETDLANTLIPDVEETNSLLHFDVYNTNGEHIGIVMDIIENSMQSILNVSSNNGSLLIPNVSHYVVKENFEEESVICQNLEELGEL